MVRQSLALKRAIDQRLNELVRRATALIAETTIANTDDMKLSQFGNVLAVATETGSVEVVKNFIRYQIGRKEGKGWQHGGFGQRLVDDIDGWLAEQAKAIEAEHPAGDLQKDTVWMELVRLYIGYLRRDWVFHHAQYEAKKKQAKQAGNGLTPGNLGQAETRGRNA